MSGCKKRAADAAAAADATIAAFGDAKRPRTSSRPTFLFCKPNQQVVEVLSRIGRVVTFTDFKTWPNSMPNNIKKLHAAEPELAAQAVAKCRELLKKIPNP